MNDDNSDYIEKREARELAELEKDMTRVETATAIQGIVLTPEQDHAVSLIVQWMEDPLNNQFKLGGYAGTGKTTIIKTILSALSKKYNIICCAFTGKACNVLQRKGISAQTLHSLMYNYVEVKPGEFTFEKKSVIFGDLFIVDEASMLSTELFKDLMSFGKKYLFVGDPGQLEPVGDNPNLMAKPDFTLSKIHRQAESSPIIQFATEVRLGGALNVKQLPGLIIRKKKLDSEEALSCSQIICAKNKTRESLNTAMRLAKKYNSEILVEGEKLICLRNNLGFGVFNGMILYVTKIHGPKKSKRTWTECIDVDVEDETGKSFSHLPLWRKPFVEELGKQDYAPKDTVHCTYGYVITCHKSQGSEWDKVLVMDEWMPPQVWDMRRWRYTAITRAAKELIYNI